MPNQNPSHETVLFDPERVKSLAVRLNELRRTDPTADLNTVLAELDATTQSLYREPLQQYLSGDGSHDAVNLDATELVEPASVPDSLAPGTEPMAADATLDVSGPYLATPPGQLPASVRAPRAKRSKSSSDPVLPASIGKFAVKRELGRGAFGVVYLGYDQELQRNVAIKLSLVSDKKIQERLRVEASKAAQIESEGIVPVYHIGTTDSGAVYIVQKYVQGSTLRAVLDEHGPLSPAAAVRLIHDIAMALEPAHLRDILHRDLKPDNVLIDDHSKPWIADFGLAISEEEQQGRRGELAGTPAYMSPEQIKGRIDFLDPRSDVWSLGVIFYEALCGKLPFNGRDRRALAEQICEMDPRPLHQRSPLLSEEINEVFLRCCAKKPSDRFASVRELAIALEQLIATGLSDQNVRGSVSTHLYADSTLIRDSTMLRTGNQIASTHRSTQQTPVPESLDVPNSHSTNTSTVVSIREPSPWWLRSISQLVTLAVMVAASVLATHLYLQRSSSTTALGHPETIEEDPSADPSADLSAGVLRVDSAQQIGSGDAQIIVDGKAIRPTTTDAGPDEAGGAGPANAGGIASAASTTDAMEETTPVPMIDADGSPEKPWVVDPQGGGSHTTLQAAIDAGPDGAVITVMPGKFTEQLRIRHPVTIEGQHDLGRSELVSADGPPLTLIVEGEGQVNIKHLHIDAQGLRATAEFNAIDVEQGTLVMESCSVRTSSFNCIKAAAGTTVSAISCQFLDSRQFAISSVDHKKIFIKDCLFRSSGLQLIGGPATIDSSEFVGLEGVYADRTLPGTVEVNGSTFDGCLGYGVAATNDATVTMSNCKFLGCKVGVQATGIDESDIGEENHEVPGAIDLVESHFENCDRAVVTDRGSVTLRKDSRIVGGMMGAAVDGGRLTIENSSISDSISNGVAVIRSGDVVLNETTIHHAGLRGVMMLAGKLTLNGGSINDSADAGIFLGDGCLGATITDVTFKNNRALGLMIEVDSIQVTIDRSQFSGSDIGIYAKAKAHEVRLGLTNCTFDDLAQCAIHASGQVRIRYRDCDFGSLEPERQVRALTPATVEKIIQVDP